MSRVDTGPTSTKGCPSTLPDSIFDPHINGHLVSTRIYNYDLITRLFIHLSQKAITNHKCYVYSYDVARQGITGVPPEESEDSTVQERGWFRDVAVFTQICTNHAIPNGQTPEEIFIHWRDSLLEFLDTNNSGGLWTRIN
ncbi:hypothetical protein BU23DRAFT_446130 [Bimuria novae-zelandiae CBS 107.79]|uniref:Uncharacterized protein n=1 Tax=Bimuria novae-zelandiae CBS 107.79 TaxID=1447943 RepID=A0A6A5VVC5_9PLEO|nr:hypothetical protein BU23DRAFT_446130 [Bimuria novae-zelandiae CBS 107.79]